MTWVAGSGAQAQVVNVPTAGSRGSTMVLRWNRSLLEAVAATFTQATISARAASMVNEAIYNAWAAYSSSADFTLSGCSRRPFWEASDTWREVAISYAAYTVLVDLFPSQKTVLDGKLALRAPSSTVYQWLGHGQAARDLGLDMGRRLLAARRNDGANQYGDPAAGTYADTSGYVPVNSPTQLVDPTRWQPLYVLDAQGVWGVQKFLTPHWGRVRPFALASGSQYRPAFSAAAGPSQAEMLEMINLSAALDLNAKALVEFWAANPGTVSPPGQWLQIAEAVSNADNNSLAEDVKLFFGVSQALLDAGIAAWDAKRAYDSARPVSAVPYYFRNQSIRAWAGPGLGTQTILGQHWRPFQRPTAPTPPFPEFVSGHSTFSAAASSVIAGLRGSNTIALTGYVLPELPRFEPVGQQVNLSVGTLSEAADWAGYSRRVGGIHFERGDLMGRALGKQVGSAVLARCQRVFS
ncbi:vanadium-dependent haloperoxidase [Aquabacterium sp. OR-4]|uniref:vanadium-dependent haloperoxidase n=1 Tax=Aquabacterium sp. OR-4 TaxID=2978127 RepID=UPI0021B203C0|nr:vanadium-dependent haloperoxidase [Aquabacterium sp. OR-4]MDT7838271.1 vanadium-dependent haloperoxidase [Aquabacterium sp. OR-4]